MQLIGNQKCVSARVVRSSEYISQILSNVHCFSVYLPFVFLILLIYSCDLANLMPEGLVCFTVVVRSVREELCNLYRSLDKSAMQSSYRLITVL